MPKDPFDDDGLDALGCCFVTVIAFLLGYVLYTVAKAFIHHIP